MKSCNMPTPYNTDQYDQKVTMTSESATEIFHPKHSVIIFLEAPCHAFIRRSREDPNCCF